MTCFVCKCDRSRGEMYFKHKTNYMCRHCLVNGLTSEAGIMFEDRSEESETYFRKIGLISSEKIKDDWSTTFGN